ncbi:RAMP superfamily CRISPR-associated protein [Dolichospermum heterosporum]|uniref:RAMP superfamily CRISPR-associated protein n=1 Tax=Dolichospermum heterosporum TAC447 TaxID=747523 RepID=A0ABY5M4Q1_9CYAN|nr:RAMP superfamily CRISPR-associated protein [Dolichospermum heterosporum]UUO16829.1 RAMP superfamily CRISPR-associated protein [Dolichospermum heterosporum TAC447]
MIKLAELPNSIQTYSITAIIDTALCIGAGGSSGSLADKPIVRNAERNLLIPASQLKGRLRHECEKIARGLKWDICCSPNAQSMCPQRAGLDGNFAREEYQISEDDKNHHCLICQIFGNPVLPSRIIFDDLICEENPENLPEIIRPGVTINRRRRTAEESKLYFLETSPANTKLRFTGNIYLSSIPNYASPLILAGLRHINALGGSKSAGLGWLTWELPNLPIEAKAWEFLAKGVENNEKN